MKRVSIDEMTIGELAQAIERGEKAVAEGLMAEDDPLLIATRKVLERKLLWRRAS